MKLRKLIQKTAHIGISNKSFRKITKVAAVAAATYFTGGAALPLIMKGAAAMKGRVAPEELLNDAWEAAGNTDTQGLSGLLSTVRGGVERYGPIVRGLRGGARAVLTPEPEERFDEDYEEEEPEEEFDEEYEE